MGVMEKKQRDRNAECRMQKWADDTRRGEKTRDDRDNDGENDDRQADNRQGKQEGCIDLTYIRSFSLLLLMLPHPEAK
ncbi:hypothetical protein WR25_13191 [Diploscapter pachys]|uniref:Uncharacterized protein n=1 Tax=Diploscapter pachys TaxID=2018661 RepID=A0A2A2KQ66_9BILA|nr:hypothetical protein WR25_13191 [Diploscapter pachys]